jgi:hypothetical protein
MESIRSDVALLCDEFKRTIKESNMLSNEFLIDELKEIHKNEE